ncbi:Clavaminate synthase-like protein [Desarmillaria tabescens]|uniref:Clavaminate synthase-like protein n=1 Tax=Armillaria tabescens TaxID=1929756 RepID=A0AA39KCI4_ARMTA|nr:Clavaminate synthase-like protein [Desarmillaria tabescens]KAK0458639.1 Clavaminate synthase-like protein [Desarmillaria tabescens]
MTIQVKHYVPPPVTKESLDYADLPIIDLSKNPRPEEVREAMQTHGFFYVVGHGLSPTENQRIFDIADIPFTDISDSEKQQYEAKIIQTGSYQGYKLRQYWHIDNGVKDQIEHYQIHRDVTMRQHPKGLRPYLEEIEAFIKHNHFNVLHPILRLLALGLGLPENALVDIHGYSSVGETSLRFIKYYPHSAEDNKKTKNVWLKGHTGTSSAILRYMRLIPVDTGSITILYSQPVSALQMLAPSGEWKWVKHIENALVINAGDALEFLSGEVYRSTIHRVVQPPMDQRGCQRLGVFYFSLPDDNVKLLPLVDTKTPSRRFVDVDTPTMEKWRKGRTAAYGKTQPRKVDGDERVEEEVIAGVVMKHYN